MWLAAADLAGLPGMPTTDRQVRAKARREKWPAMLAKRTKGAARPKYVYPLDALPAATQLAALDRARASVPIEGGA